MNNVIEKENINYFIYEIRGKLVILDSDLATLYKIETKRINEGTISKYYLLVLLVVGNHIYL